MFLSSTAQWQEISSIYMYPYGQLMLSSNKFFLLGVDPNNPSPMYMVKTTFGSLSADWTNIMPWSSGVCSAEVSDSLLNSDGSLIYSIFPYGSTKYIYFTILNSTDGSLIGSVYKSNNSCTSVYGIVQSGYYLAVTWEWTDYFLILLNTISMIFTWKAFNLNDFNQGIVDPGTRR